MIYNDQFSIQIAFLIFITYFILDMFYAYYIICIENKQNFMSSLMAGLVTSLAAFGVVSFSKNMVYIIPLFLGAFSGTYATMKLKEIYHKNEK